MIGFVKIPKSFMFRCIKLLSEIYLKTLRNERLMQITPEYLKIPLHELGNASKVSLTILPDQEGLYEHFARSIINEIKHNHQTGEPTRLILPVGPVGQYPVLVRLSNLEGIGWENVHIFNMDEYCDWQGRLISSRDPISFRGFMQREFVDRLEPELRIPKNQLLFPDPLNLDQISQRIQEVGGIDTCYGGIGYHGHVAFNEPIISRWHQITPDEYLKSKTRLVKLAPETVVMNSIRATGGNPQALPPMAVTLGMADIYSARRIRLYCQGGTWQRTVLRIALMAEPSVDYPVTLLQGHPDYKIITTKDTAQVPGVMVAA
jgi:glucosamine-6-phosphate deaminase